MNYNQSDHVPTRETNNIDQYKRKCKYKISKFILKIDKKEFDIPGDTENGIFNALVEESDCAQISAEFIGNVLKENFNHVILQGPSLSSTCTIPVSKIESYDREFGYIQTSKRLLERQFEKAISCSDFHANLLHGQDEVLDSDGRNNPFYGETSYYKVPADSKQRHPIELKFLDYPSSETLSKPDWGCLVKQKKYQQFFVYLVKRSKNDNGDWNYQVLYSFDWFIYLKWKKVTSARNNIFEYNCGLHEHKRVRELPDWIDSKEFYVCNDDQFSYWIDLEDCIFNIDYYPNSIYKSKLEKIYDNIKMMFSDVKKYFEFIKSNISNAKKLVNNVIEDLKENREHVESIPLEENSEINSFVIILRECIRKMDLMKSEDYYQEIDNVCRSVENICNFVEHINLANNKCHEDYINIDWNVKNFYKRIGNIDLGIIEYRESSESITSKVNKLKSSIKVINSIEYEVYEGIKCLILKLEKLCEYVERRDSDKFKFDENYESSTCEIKRILQFIENMKSERDKFYQIHENTNSEVNTLLDYINILNSEEHRVYEGIEGLLPKIEKLCKSVDKWNSEENAFIEYYQSIVVRRLCVFIESIDLKVSEFREYSECIVSELLKLSKYFESLNSIEHEVYENIKNLFPEVEKLNKEFEKLYLRRNIFRMRFPLIAVDINKLYSCIEIIDLEKNSYRENFKSIFLDVKKFPKSTESIELKLVKDIIDGLYPKIDKLSTDKLSNFSKLDLRNKIKKAIINRNEKENTSPQSNIPQLS